MRATVLCLAAIAQLMLSMAEAGPVKIPLYPRAVNGSIIKVPGASLDNGLLAGKVLIGTPPREFTMAFDTTTGYSWVRSYKCTGENCQGRKIYNPRKSSSAESTGLRFAIDYGEACVDTCVYTDTVNVAGVDVQNFPFGGAYRMGGFGSGFDGYLGLGRSVDYSQHKIYVGDSQDPDSHLSRRDAVPGDSSFASSFQSGSAVQSSQFSIYTTAGVSTSFDAGIGTSTTTTTTTTDTTSSGGSVSNITATTTGISSFPSTDSSTTSVTNGGIGFFRKRSADAEEPAGYLVLGGVDTSVISGDVAYINTATTSKDSNGWDISISHASFGDKLKLKQDPSTMATLSSSSPYITMPCHQADAFHRTFGGIYYEDTMTYGIKCSDIKNMPPLQVTIGNYTVEVPATYWTHEVDKGRDCCATSISRSKNDQNWIFGTAFTNAFYTTFDPDNNRVGLALKNGNPNGLKITQN